MENNKLLLYPRQFILRVDNRSLCFIKTLATPGRLLERFLCILSNYNFVVEHRKSEQIPNVDYLSRDGSTGEPSSEELEMEASNKILQFHPSPLNRKT